MNKNIFLIYSIFILCILSEPAFSFEFDKVVFLKKDRKLRLITIESSDTNFLIVNSYEGWGSEQGRKTTIDWMLKGDTTNVGIQIDEKSRRLKITVAKDEIMGIEGKSPVLAGIGGAIFGGAGHMYVGGDYYLTGFLMGTLDAASLFAFLVSWGKSYPISLPVSCGLRVFGAIFSPIAADDYNKKLQKKYGVPVLSFKDNKENTNINIFTYNVKF